MEKYTRWEDIPANLKTKTSLNKMGLKLKRGQQPVAIKAATRYTPDYNLYEVSEAVPNVVSDAQKVAATKAQEESLKKRTCTRCGFVQELGREYRRKVYVRNGICDRCADREIEESRLAGDHAAAVEWAQQILKRDDVLILDTETTDLDGEIIELAMINLKGETVYNGRFNPLTPISAGAQAVHGISSEMVANEPLFSQCYKVIKALLVNAGLVLIYNAAFDVPRLKYTSRRHGFEIPDFKADCIMEWYAQYCGEWSDYHGSYRWQPLNGGHDALGDCLAALACLKEMAAETIEVQP